MNIINAKRFIAMMILSCILLSLFISSSNLVHGSEGSIAKSYTYPEDGGAYFAVNHFVYQLTEVNVNTTISLRIDDGPLIPMIYQGEKNGTSINTTDCQWYTWQVSVPAITTPGKHAFQFFSNYFVWQDKDNFWAKFSARTDPKFFTIDNSPQFAAGVPEKSMIPIYVGAMSAVGLAGDFYANACKETQKTA